MCKNLLSGDQKGLDIYHLKEQCKKTLFNIGFKTRRDHFPFFFLSKLLLIKCHHFVSYKATIFLKREPLCIFTYLSCVKAGGLLLD